MKKVTVSASSEYDVLIGAGLLTAAGEQFKTALPGAEKLAVVTDDNVELLYADTLEQSLAAAGFDVCRFVLPHGEAEKTGENYLQLLRFLADEGLTRADAVIALGGGVVGDLAGFAAATYLRGVRFVQMPTTLLAMVDSSVGGKCAVDLPAGKNLAGAFYQPCAVLADTDCLATLPPEEFAEGCAEILKYAILGDAALFDTLTRCGRSFDRETVIAACVEAKANYVAADERDGGVRALLNLGHTVGHAVERRSDYTVSHGEAVAMGLGVMARAADAAGDCGREDADAVCAALRAFGLPDAPNYPPAELLPLMYADKKRRGDTITLAVIRGIGNCELRTLPFAKLESYLKAGF